MAKKVMVISVDAEKIDEDFVKERKAALEKEGYEVIVVGFQYSDKTKRIAQQFMLGFSFLSQFAVKTMHLLERKG